MAKSGKIDPRMGQNSVRIPDYFLDKLRESLRIEDIIRARVPIKKAGSDYKGLCPFHNEKSPSFHVSPAKQFFHCFGCNASGDIIKFVKDFDKLSFLETIECQKTSKNK